jgi:hypothetical protein
MNDTPSSESNDTTEYNEINQLYEQLTADASSIVRLKPVFHLRISSREANFLLFK